MKRILSFLMLVLMMLPAVAEQEAKGKRIVLKPTREFKSVQVSGNIVVDCRFHEKYSGYVVYHTTDDAAPRVKVESYNDVLVISGDSTDNAIESRVVVLCHDELKCVIANNAVVLSNRIPKTKEFDVVINGNGGFFTHMIDCSSINIVNNSSRGTAMGEVNCVNVSAVNNGGGFVKMKKVECDTFKLANNGSGDFKSKEIDCSSFLAVNYGSGNLGIKKLDCANVSVVNNCSGEVRINGKIVNE